MSRVENGQRLPTLTVQTVGGGTITVPDDLAGSFGVVLIYRGSWCPYCNAQLAAFARAADTFAELGIKTVALSVDDEQTASQTVAKHHVTFPLGHSADAHKISEQLDSYLNADPLFLQSTGFVLNPDGTVVTAVYSSGAIGRLVPEDVAGLVRFTSSRHR